RARANPRSPTGGCWPSATAARWSSSGPRPAARTRSASTPRAASACRCSETRFTAKRPARRARCCMLPGSRCRARANRRSLLRLRSPPTSRRWASPMDELAARALALAEESFIAASGPGGQNVNKVATAVQLRLDVFALRLEPAVFRRLKALAGSRMTAKGEIVITARRFRTQEANREDARARLAALIEQAQVEPKKRAKTRVNRVGKEQRIKAKKARGAVKAGRGRVEW